VASTPHSRLGSAAIDDRIKKQQNEIMKKPVTSFKSISYLVITLLMLAVAVRPGFGALGFCPTFSPDGKEVLFPVLLLPVEDEKAVLHEENCGTLVLLYNLSNKTTKVIFRRPDLVTATAVWGPDGKEVLIASVDQNKEEPMKVTILPAGKSTPTRELEVKEPAVLAQGLMVPPPVVGRSMFFSGRGIIRLNLGTGACKVVGGSGPKSTFPADESCSDFVFSAAGRLFYLDQSGCIDAAEAGEAVIGTLDPDKLTRQSLLKVEWSADPVIPWSAAIPRDGSRIAVSWHEGPNAGIGIYRAVPPGPPALATSDIRDLRSLATRLKEHTNAISQFVWESLSDTTRGLVAGYSGKAGDDQTVKDALVRELNVVLKGDCIAEHVRLSEVALSRAADRQLRKHTEQAQQGDDLIRLNRMLLEDAYPAEIADHRPLEWTLPISLERTRQNIRYTGSLGNLEWSADGKTIYAAGFIPSGDKGEDEQNDFLLGELPVSGAKPRWTRLCQLDSEVAALTLSYMGWIALSPDGQTIVASTGLIRSPAKKADQTLFLVGLSGKDPKVTSIRIPLSDLKRTSK
jgi:hypothetical protein